MTTTVQSRSPREHTALLVEESLLAEESSMPLEAPLWLLAGVENEEEVSFEPHIWRGID